MSILLSLASTLNGEKYIPEVNDNTFAIKPYQSLFQEHFGNTLATPVTFNFIVGTDSGLAIRYLLETGPAQDSIYVFVEHKDIIPTVKQLISDLTLPPQVILCELENWQESSKDYDIAAYILKKRYNLHRSLAVCNAKFSAYNDFDQRAKSAYELKAYEVRGGMDTKAFIAAQFANLAENITPAGILKNKFCDYTCVVLGAGPSLNNEIEWIRNNRDALLVIAVSRIAQTLIDAEISPDIILTVDPGDVCFDTSCTMLKLDPNVVFVNAYHVNPRLLAQWSGHSVYLGEAKPWDFDIDKDNIPVQGPTVSHAAITTAAHLGCKTILLTGVDMCYSSSGVSHAAGTAEGDSGMNLTRSAYWVETYNGNTARTSEDLMHGINIMKELVTTIASTGTTLYNLSKDAARIDGISAIDHQDIVPAQPTETARERLLALIPDTTAATRTQHNQSLLDKLKQSDRQLGDIIALCQKALDYNKKLFRPTPGGDNYKYKHKMDSVQEKLDNKYHQLSTLIKNYGLTNFFEFIDPGDMTHWSDKKIELHGKHYYEAYIKSAKELSLELHACSKRIQSRLEEDKKSPNLSKLIAQWKEDRQPGRAILWRARNTARYELLDNDNKTAIDHCIEEFFKNVDFARSDYKNRRAAVSDKVAYSDVLRSYKKGDQQALGQFIVHYGSETGEAMRNIVSIAKAFLLFLQSSYAESLIAISNVDSKFIHEEEMQLALSLSIKLNDSHCTEFWLKALSEKDHRYMPQYAKILKMNNKIEDAAQVYTGYLQENPTDIETWHALKSLYIDAKANDLADMVEKLISEHT